MLSFDDNLCWTRAGKARQHSERGVMVSSVDVANLPLARLVPLVGSERIAVLNEQAASFQERIGERTIWNINSTAQGGGVAEMLQSLVGYARSAGIDTQWLVIEGYGNFFAITKRLHNQIHGLGGDGGPLGEKERHDYDEVMDANLAELLELIDPGDLVLLHDPQTAGLADALKDQGAIVVWRCHIGIDESNEWTESAWAFLRPYLERVDHFVFSRPSYVPQWITRERVAIIPPSIDPFSPKNQELGADDVRRILTTMGLFDGAVDQPGEFIDYDGNRHVVEQSAEIVQFGASLDPAKALIIQVSRWDQLKDMPGVMAAFVERVLPETDAHLVLVGASVSDVSDDPEGAQVLSDVMAQWSRLSDAERSRVTLVSLPMSDLGQNAAMVNAIQRHASVVVQKSLAEGFGITVTEALWKSKPMVASAVGGINDQILLENPRDLQRFGDDIAGLLARPRAMDEMGRRAHAYVLENYIGDKHLLRYVDLFTSLLDSNP